jgi:hypothetical protein
MDESGGAVMVHIVAEQLNSGKRVRMPILLPCVDETADISENLAPEVLPVGKEMAQL